MGLMVFDPERHRVVVDTDGKIHIADFSDITSRTVDKASIEEAIANHIAKFNLKAVPINIVEERMFPRRKKKRNIPPKLYMKQR